MTEFSDLLLEFGNKSRKYNGFDEAAAILRDVYDNIIQVKQMIEDFSSTCPNEYRKDFLSPAKRSLLFVDPTLDYPLMLYNDFIVLLEYFYFYFYLFIYHY